MQNNNNSKEQNILGMIIWGFAVRIIITVIVAIALGKLVPLAGAQFGFSIGGWFKPTLIIGAILIGIIFQIKYAVRVYRILKSKYLALEQQAADIAAANLQNDYNYTQYPNDRNY